MQIDANTRHGLAVRRLSRRGRVAVGLCALVVGTLAIASTAHAADRIYWSDYDINEISYANLNGSGGAEVPTGAATVNGPMGMTIDSAAGRIYWANWGAGPLGDGHTISYANLDGSGGGADVPIDPAFVNGPHGLAIDPVGGKIYWPNFATNTISVANLDGSGAGNLNTGAATVNGPRGVALDPGARRIYWANWSGNAISYANLDGSGGGDIPTGTATVNQPEGVALDPVAGRIYWAAYRSTNTISFANLDGSGGADLPTGPVAPNDPHGVAIDPAARRIYWPNYSGNTISFANLDGSGGADIPTPGAPIVGPDQPVLLEAPGASGTPTVKGGNRPGSTLRCTQGAWGSDLPGSLLYRGPSSTSYDWIRQGKRIPMETKSSIRIGSAGNYRCRVTAANAAGQASQTSDPHPAFKVGKPKLNRRKGTARLLVEVPGPGTLRLEGKHVVKERIGRVESPLGTEARKVGGGKVGLLVKAKGKAKKRLIRLGRAKVKVRVIYRERGEAPGAQTKRVKLIHR